MRMPTFRPLLALLALLLASLGFAGTLTVTSPSSGDYVGKTTTVKFNIEGATRDVKVTATATVAGGTTSTSQNVTVTPNASDHTANGTITLTFADNAQGDYTLVVSATETGNAYASTTLNVTVDAVAPKFLTLSPVNGGYVRSIIKIRASVDEPNMDEWVVTVNGIQVPNSATGSTVFSADFDTAGITNDGSVQISIVAKDLAKNQTSKSVSLTLDRVPPTIQIVYPGTSTNLRVGQDVTVIVDVTDASTSSLDRTGIDVIATAGGTYITRVTFVSLVATSGTTQRWTGRIRYQKRQLPTNFVISATAVDKAGNVAVPQETPVHFVS